MPAGVIADAHAGGDEVLRRIVTGPAMFVPRVGEWTHQFKWLNVDTGNREEFEVLSTGSRRLGISMPVRTADGVLTTVKLSLEFEVKDVAVVLKGSEDPIDALKSLLAADLAEFGSLARSTDLLSPEARNCFAVQLGNLATYKKMVTGASSMGLNIIGLCLQALEASRELQKQYEEAITSKARLAASRAKEEQQQELVDLRLANEKRRMESEQALATAKATHKLHLQAEARQQRFEHDKQANTQVLGFLEGLQSTGVDLTKYLVSFSGQRATAPHLRQARVLSHLGSHLGESTLKESPQEL